MTYTPPTATVAPAASWRKPLPGPGHLEIEWQENGNCCVYAGRVRVARATLLHLDQPGAYIAHLHVKKNYRRRGYGRRLTQALLQLAQQAGCEGISLHVQIGNATAVALYKRVGFFLCGTTVDEDPHYVMAQRLRR